MTDLQGIALVLGAAATFLTALAGAVLQVLTFMRMGKLHDSVNGQTSDLKKAIADAAYGAGEKAGGDAERARGE